MKNSILRKVIATMLVSVLLCGCGNSSQEQAPAKDEAPTSTATEASAEETAVDEPITITYCNFNASGGNEATLDSMYQEFHKVYPNINVEIETIAFDDYFTTLQTRIAGNVAPDCFEMNIENFGAYASQGVLADLAGADLSGLNETALSAFQYNGVQYGVPECFSTVILVYNKDLFDQAGIAYPDASWTREDVDKAAAAIRALGDDIFGIYQPVTYNEYYKVAAQYGGSLLSEDGKAFTIDTDANLTALESMVSRVQETNVQPTADQMGGMGDWDLFESGRLGMIPTGTWCFNTFTDACDFSWDICVEPGQTQKATHFFSNAVVVSATASDEAKKAAETWVSFLTSSKETAKIRLDAGWDLPAINDNDALSSYLEITPPENRAAVFDSMNSLVLPPVINDYSKMQDIITNAVSSAASGECTAKEALEKAQKECEDSIKLQ